MIIIDTDSTKPLVAELVETTAQQTRLHSPYNWRRLWLAIACHIESVWIERSPNNVPADFDWLSAATDRFHELIHGCLAGNDVSSEAMLFSDYYQDVLNSVGFDWLPIVGTRIIAGAQALTFASSLPLFSDEDHLVRMVRMLHEIHDYFHVVGDISSVLEIEKALGPALGFRYVRHVFPALVELCAIDSQDNKLIHAFLRYERAVVLCQGQSCE